MDPALTTLEGHSYNYFSSLAKIARTLGFEVEIIGNDYIRNETRLVDIVYPGFLDGIDPAHSSSPRKNSKVHNENLLSDLHKISEAFKITKEDIVIVNSVRHWSLPAFGKWVQTFRDGGPNLKIILHFTCQVTNQKSTWEAMYKLVFAEFNKSFTLGKVDFFADSEALVDEFHKLGARGISLVPVPSSYEMALKKNHHDHNLRTVGYLGAARKDKGFDLLSLMLKFIDPKVHPLVDFKFMATAAKSNGMEEEALKLKSLGCIIELEPLSEQEFGSFAREIDILVIPYRSELYNFQTSGVLVDGIFNRCWPIVPSGTWLSNEVLKSGIGSVFARGDVLDLCSKIENAAIHQPWRAETYENSLRNYSSKNSMRNIAMSLLGV
jgi:hypothetical protein